jgi:hypothetical protein
MNKQMAIEEYLEVMFSITAVPKLSYIKQSLMYPE